METVLDYTTNVFDLVMGHSLVMGRYVKYYYLREKPL